MSDYGGDPAVELECRIRGGVSRGVFARVLAKLREAGAGTWARAVTEESWDVQFQGSRVRATYSAGGGAPRYLRKEREQEPQMSGVGSLLGGVGKSLLRGGSASFEDASLDAQLLAIDQKAKVKIKKMVPQKYEVW